MLSNVAKEEASVNKSGILRIKPIPDPTVCGNPKYIAKT
jgi:hypothetical protein